MCANGAEDGFKFVEIVLKTWDCKFPLHDNFEPAPCVRFNCVFYRLHGVGL